MSGLGPHGGFILAAHAATALVIGVLLVRAVLDHRAQRAALARFEAPDALRTEDLDPVPERRPAGADASSKAGSDA